jgi:excisionase family DNA binding protein
MVQQSKRAAARESGEILTPHEVAALLKLSVATVKRRFQDGTIPAKRIGDVWRCSRSAVDRLFQVA